MILNTKTFSRDDLDAFKGLFIILIVIGHNTLITDSIPGLFRLLYSFHVQCFLFFPFLFPAKIFGREETQNSFVRYLVPYVIFVTLASVLYLIIFAEQQFDFQWAKNLATALTIGSARALDSISGFQLYWFLPALLTMTILRSFVQKQNSLTSLIIFSLTLIIHVSISYISENLKSTIPFGVLIVAYIYPLGIIAAYIVEKSFNTRMVITGWISLVVFLSSITIISTWGTRVNLALLNLYGIKDPIKMLVHDIAAISAFISGIYFSRHLPRIFVEIGKFSLFIFLTHSLIYQFILQLMRYAAIDTSSFTLALGIGTFIFTLGISLSIAKWLHNKFLWNLIFPRNLNDLKDALCLKGLRIKR